MNQLNDDRTVNLDDIMNDNVDHEFITVHGQTVMIMIKKPLTDVKKDAIFDDIDKDKNGTLDIDEFIVYILGRFNITRNAAMKIFQHSDLDGNRNIDKAEFRILLGNIDAINIQIDRERETQKMKHLMCAGKWSSCAIGTCLCTAGLSCIIGGNCAAREGLKMKDVIDAAEVGREAQLVTSLTMEKRNELQQDSTNSAI